MHASAYTSCTGTFTFKIYLISNILVLLHKKIIFQKKNKEFKYLLFLTKFNYLILVLLQLFVKINLNTIFGKNSKQ